MSERDSFTEVTSDSYGQRLAGSLMGILIGVVLFLVAFPLLFWNEGRAVHRAQSLEEGGSAVVAISPDRVDPANDGKLVHLSGLATTNEKLVDTDFGVSAQALRLIRTVEIYQWNERKTSKREKEVGGSEKTTTTYDYYKDWSSSVSASHSFKQPGGHENPSEMLYQDATQQAQSVTLGAFALPDNYIERIGTPVKLAVTAADLPAQLREKVQVHGDQFYYGDHPTTPQVGDLLIAFNQVPPAQVSIVARQQGSTFTPFKTSDGGQIEIVRNGTHSAAELFTSAQADNALWLWVLRLGGFLSMFFGLSSVLKPLSVVADLLPFLGSLVGKVTSLAAFLLAIPFALLTVAVAWVFYRPLLAAILIGISVLGLVLIKFVPNKEKA